MNPTTNPPQTAKFRTGYRRAFICHSNGDIHLGKQPVYEYLRITKRIND